MTRQSQMGRRLDQLDRTVDRQSLIFQAEALAARIGCSSGELLAEAEVIAITCHRNGIVTWDEMLAWQAAELGISTETLAAEVTEMLT